MVALYRHSVNTRGEYVIQIPASVMLEFVVVADDYQSALDELLSADTRHPITDRDGSTEMFDYGDTSIRVKGIQFDKNECVDFVEYDESGVC